MATQTRCQRCGYEKKSNYCYEECPVCGAPMLFISLTEKMQK